MIAGGSELLVLRAADCACAACAALLLLLLLLLQVRPAGDVRAGPASGPRCAAALPTHCAARSGHHIHSGEALLLLLLIFWCYQ
jgi:hypothetical protein